MYHEDETELTLDERTALASLSRAMPVSDMLEARVVRALRNDGHFGAHVPRESSIPLPLKVAAAIALFAGGVAKGRYVLADENAERAAATPTVELRDIPPSRAPAEKPASRRGETIVAEREMWL